MKLAVSASMLVVSLAFNAVPVAARHSAPPAAAAQAETPEQVAARLRQHGWLGVEVSRSATSSNITIVKVTSGGPAEAAGLKPGDVLTGANGVVFDKADAATLERLNQDMKPGTPVTYAVLSGASSREVRVTLGTMPEDLVARAAGLTSAPSVATTATAPAERTR